MDIKPIRSHAGYETALAQVSPLFDREPEPGTVEGDRFDVLVTLIEAYECVHFPIDVIKFRMEQQDLTPADLQPMIGRLNRVYEVLNRKCPLTMAMVRRLHRQLGIPAESPIGAYAQET